MGNHWNMVGAGRWVATLALAAGLLSQGVSLSWAVQPQNDQNASTPEAAQVWLMLEADETVVEQESMGWSGDTWRLVQLGSRISSSSEYRFLEHQRWLQTQSRLLNQGWAQEPEHRDSYTD